MDMTDDGVAFTTMDGRVWFADGLSVDQIGDLGVRAEQGSPELVRSASVGSLLAWFEHPEARRGELVVYDTDLRRVVAREVPAGPAGCADLGSECVVAAVVGDHVYWTSMHNGYPGQPQMRLDVSADRQGAASSRDLAADLASGPRGIILGDSPDTGVVTDGMEQRFVVDGTNLVPVREGRADGNPALFPTTAFDTGTRAQLQLRVPEGYDRAAEFTAFEWLDDDRLALMAYANQLAPGGFYDARPGPRDILVCHISTGRCDLAVKGTMDVRIAPHLGLPG